MLGFELSYIIGTPDDRNELHQHIAIHWFFDLKLHNIGRSSAQVIGLDISQARPEGTVKWSAADRLNENSWIEAGGTCSYRFRDTDLTGASPKDPFRVIATVSPDQKFEITHRPADGIKIVSPHGLIVKALIAQVLDQLGIDNPEQLDEDSLRRLGITGFETIWIKATDLYG